MVTCSLHKFSQDEKWSIWATFRSTFRSTQLFFIDSCSLFIFSNFSFISWNILSTLDFCICLFQYTKSSCVWPNTLFPSALTYGGLLSCVFCVFWLWAFAPETLICLLWGLGSRYYFREALCLLLPVVWRTPNLNSLTFKNCLVSWIWVIILYVDYTIVMNSQGRFRCLFKIHPAPESRQPNFRGSLLQVKSMGTFTLALWSPSFMGEVLFLIYTFLACMKLFFSKFTEITYIQDCIGLRFSWFDIHIYCEMTDTIKLVNTSVTSYSYFFLYVVRIFKIYSLSNFHVYNSIVNYSHQNLLVL